MSFKKPHLKPTHPNFSSGPCAKIPGWSPALLNEALVARSHRSDEGMQKLHTMIELTRTVLEIPEDYALATLSGSATAAVESALWNLLGSRPVVVFSMDVFSQRWATDIEMQLKLSPLEIRQASVGQIPDVSNIPKDHDSVLTWNGSTAGVKFEDGDWLDPSRSGLVIADITSAAFTTEIPWKKFDAIAFSWQKGLGGEAGQGMLALSPKAIKRLEDYLPAWPLPYLFKLRAGQHFYKQLFQELTLNTPSLLCVEDFIQSLVWAQKVGGLKGLIARVETNYGVVDAWVKKTPWIDFLAQDPATRSHSTVALEIVSPWFKALETDAQWECLSKMTALLAQHQAAYDIKNHTGGVPSLRLWCGPTVEATDLEKLMPWLDWGYEEVAPSLSLPD
jgi:phosphoserine aminotransferase